MVARNRYTPRYMNRSNWKMPIEAGAGITEGVSTVYRSSVSEVGGIITTEILIDLTGLSSSTTLLDIIGKDATALPCHFGRVTEAVNGTIMYGTVTCLETPAGGAVTDIDFYSATEGTGVETGPSTGLTVTILLEKAGAWSAAVATPFIMTGAVVADQYLYLMTGDTGSDGTYNAGRFSIKLVGYHA